MRRRSVLFVGGDIRQIYCAEFLSKCGLEVSVFGFDKAGSRAAELVNFSSLKVVLSLADFIVLPLPFSFDDIYLNLPYCSEKIEVRDFVKNIDSSQIVLYGKGSTRFEKMLEEASIKHFDYFKDEVLTLKNAAYTAESALQIAAENSERSFYDSEVLITGYGRIGEYLASLLKAYNAKVTVAVRREEIKQRARLHGLNAIDIEKTGNTAQKYDFVFNTVDKQIFDFSVLKNMNEDVLLIDLASKSGFDSVTANNIGLKLITARGLPGKLLPCSSGFAQAQVILRLIEENRHG